MSASTRWWQRGIFALQTGYVALALIVLLIVMHFASPYFFTEGNMQNVAKNFSFIAIATLGVTFVIITGGIDLSVGSMMCFSAMITSMVMTELSTPGIARRARCSCTWRPTARPCSPMSPA